MATAYVGRFAPSPTGALHLGGARTALVAWMRARAQGGRFILRVEDLDPPRVVQGAEQRILADLRWLGLDWDEGPDVGGPSTPYHQSARASLYVAAIDRLRTQGLVFDCTCTRREIASASGREVPSIASAPHGEEDEGPRYPGTCRGGPTHPERPRAQRLRLDEDAPDFLDLLHGPISGRGRGGDFVLRRADGLFAYQLAVVVDDIAMGITEIVRGDDLLPSTPKQVALHQALGAAPPAFLHVPLILGPDGARLSKRHGGTTIAEHRAAGWAPERLLGLLGATLGLVAPRTALSLRDLLEVFSLDRMPRDATTLHETLSSGPGAP